MWFGCKHAVLSLRRHKTGGSIINTASVVASVVAAARYCGFRLRYTVNAYATDDLVSERVGTVLRLGWPGVKTLFTARFKLRTTDPDRGVGTQVYTFARKSNETIPEYVRHATGLSY